MKILLASTRYLPLFGGIENSIHFMAKEMLAQGHEVTILTSDLSPSDLSIDLDEHDKKNSPVNIKRYSRLRLPGFLQVFSFFIQFFNVFSATKNTSWDIIIARDVESALPLFIKYGGAKKAYIAPGCAYNQNLRRLETMWKKGEVRRSAFLYNKYWYLVFMRLMQRKVLKKADLVSAWSKNTLRELRGDMVFTNQWEAINPGVDFVKFKRRQAKRDKNDPLKLLMLCRFDPLKNINHAIEAVSKLDFHVHLNIVGSGSYERELKELTINLGVEEKVSFLAGTRKQEQYYCQADYFLMLSSYEPFGQTIIEAMACGVPVIAYKACESVNNAVIEIIEDGKDGYLIDYGVDSVVDILKHLEKISYTEALKVSERAEEKIKKLYRWDETVKEIKKLLS